jgi:hypothetical protein
MQAPAPRAETGACGWDLRRTIAAREAISQGAASQGTSLRRECRNRAHSEQSCSLLQATGSLERSKRRVSARSELLPAHAGSVGFGCSHDPRKPGQSLANVAEAADQQAAWIQNTGERLSRRQAARLTDGVRTYLLQVDAYWSIDGSRGGSGAEYINHCCEPNLKGRRAEGRVWLIARRSIAADEETTFDYRFHPDSPRVPCYCGVGNCRGTLNRKPRAVHD